MLGGPSHPGDDRPATAPGSGGVPAGGRNRARSSVTEAATTILGERFDEVARALSDLHENPEGPAQIHAVRVATRRATAAIQVFRAHLDASLAGKARQRLRRLRRAAGAARGCDVNQEMLEAFARQESSASSVAAELMLARVDAWRAEARRALSRARRKHTPKKMLRLGEKLLASVHLALAPRTPGDRHVYSHAAGPSSFGETARLAAASAARRLGDLAAGPHSFEALHEMRLAGKRLRYILELVGPALGEDAADGCITTLRKLQDRLGDVNDRHELALRVDQALAELGLRRTGKTAASFRALHDSLIEQRDRLTEEFEQWWPHRAARLAVALAPLTGDAGVLAVSPDVPGRTSPDAREGDAGEKRVEAQSVPARTDAALTLRRDDAPRQLENELDSAIVVASAMILRRPGVSA